MLPQVNSAELWKPIKKSVIIKTGAERTRLYLNLLRGKNVAIVANQTSIIEKTKKKTNLQRLNFITISRILITVCQCIFIRQ